MLFYFQIIVCARNPTIKTSGIGCLCKFDASLSMIITLGQNKITKLMTLFIHPYGNHGRIICTVPFDYCDTKYTK